MSLPRARIGMLAVMVVVVVGTIAAVVVVLTSDKNGSSSSNNNKSSPQSGSTSPSTVPSSNPTLWNTASPSAVAISDAPTSTRLSPSMFPTLVPTSSDIRPGEILLGNSNNVEYYHCNAPKTIDDNTQIVLLHGASFSKEVWMSTGILQQFCDASFVTAAALDFPVSSNHVDLMTMLNALEKDGIVKKPVTLVTPSASGFTIVDWMIRGSSLLSEFVSVWVPVAPGSLSRASNAQVARIRVNILAIYGSQDTAGKRYSQRLVELAGATAVELEGGHAVYRQSPNEFVAEILAFVE